MDGSSLMLSQSVVLEGGQTPYSGQLTDSFTRWTFIIYQPGHCSTALNANYGKLKQNPLHVHLLSDKQDTLPQVSRFKLLAAQETNNGWGLGKSTKKRS